MPCQLQIEPNPVMVDDVVCLQVTGLHPHENITFRARLQENGDRFYSYAHYVSDKSGTVDVLTWEAKGGTYTGD